MTKHRADEGSETWRYTVGWARSIGLVIRCGCLRANSRTGSLFVITWTYNIAVPPWHVDILLPTSTWMAMLMHHEGQNLRPRSRCRHARRPDCPPSRSAPHVTLESCAPFELLEAPAPVSGIQTEQTVLLPKCLSSELDLSPLGQARSGTCCPQFGNDTMSTPSLSQWDPSFLDLARFLSRRL